MITGNENTSNAPAEAVAVYGDGTRKEYGAAEKLKQIIETGLALGERRRVLLYSSTILFGQRRRDLDIFMLGTFPKGIVRKLSLINHQAKQEVAFYNIVAAIEVKDHISEDVKFEGVAAHVLYSNGWSNVTTQSEEQKDAAIKYLKHQFGWAPYVCNLIWFRNLKKSDLPQFTNNYLAADSTFNDVLEKLCIARLYLYENRGQSPRWRFYCTKVAKAEELAEKEHQLFSLFAKYRNSIGALTRSRLERITRQELLKDQLYAQSIGKRLVLIRGRAGTGKTIKLLHIAYDLCSRGERVLILTYNRMLVSDLQRMVALAGVSSDMDGATVEIDTIHRFIRRLLDHFKLEYDKNRFLESYEEHKRTLLEYLRTGLITEDDIRLLKRDETNWDKVLIDEGQDWPEDERDILYRLFDPKNFIVASGTGQFVRSMNLANWQNGIDYHKPIISEKRSLRQKRNLCAFQTLYADTFGIKWDLQPSDDLTGGRVIIVKGSYTKALHERLFANCKADENGAYEYMFLVPPSLTVCTDGEKRFALTDEFKRWGVKVWDGVIRKNRTEYPTDVDEHRVVTYESARGLEGWVVVSLALDSFVEYKEKNPYIADVDGVSPSGQLAFGLQSPQERIRNLVHEWVLIALTRAIDTIVITLSNPSSEYSRQLLDIAAECNHFARIEDGPPCREAVPERRQVAAPSSGTVDSTPKSAVSLGGSSAPEPRGQATATVGLKAEAPIRSGRPLGPANDHSDVTLSVDTVPWWCIELFRRLVSTNEREFVVQVTHKYVYFAGEPTRTGPRKWRDALPGLVQLGFLEIVKRVPYDKANPVRGKLFPLTTETFWYRITDEGLAQDSEWALQQREGKLKSVGRIDVRLPNPRLEAFRHRKTM